MLVLHPKMAHFKVFCWIEQKIWTEKKTKTRGIVCSQEPADLSKQFPELAEDIHIPQFFQPDQFFSSVFRISSCGLQLWTHYDVSKMMDQVFEV